MRRVGVYIGCSLLLIGTISAAADALVVSEREELERFVDDITGEVSQSRIDHALRYADPSELALEVVHGGKVDQYNTNNESALATDARAALSPLSDSQLRLIQQSINIDGDNAQVAVRVRTADGFANALFQLRRRDNRWIARRIVVS